MWMAGSFLAITCFPRAARLFSVTLILRVSTLSLIGLVAVTPLVLYTVLLFPVRFLMGLGTTLIYMVCLTAVVAASRPDVQGLMLGVVSTTTTAAEAAGAAGLRFTGIERVTPYALCGCCLVLTAVVVLFHDLRRFPCPTGNGLRASLSRSRLLLRSFLFFLPACLVGASHTLFTTFLPIYGSRLGLDPRHAALLLSGAFTGSVLLTIPFTWAGDRIGYIRAMAVGSLAVVAAEWVIHRRLGLLALASLMVLAIGGVLTAVRNMWLVVLSRRRGNTAEVVAAVSLAGKIGSIGGVLATGVLMDRFGPSAFLWALGATCGSAMLLTPFYAQSAAGPVTGVPIPEPDACATVPPVTREEA
jgi:predicted MFS family arabinose efflux permease